MHDRAPHGGRHELGQNFLTHSPSIRRIVDLVAETRGAILELGAGDGALTAPLAQLDRPLTAIDIDERRVRRLQRRLPTVDVREADALQHPFDHPVLVGNVPFHLTTPILRRLLWHGRWTHAILLTQWEVARKRAGVGGSTMMTAQTAPWFCFALHGRVPAHHFAPMPSVDGGILGIAKRVSPLVDLRERARYDRFVRDMFTGRGSGLAALLQRPGRLSRSAARSALRKAGVEERMLPRDLSAQQWASLWHEVRRHEVRR